MLRNAVLDIDYTILDTDVFNSVGGLGIDREAAGERQPCSHTRPAAAVDAPLQSRDVIRRALQLLPLAAA